MTIAEADGMRLAYIAEATEGTTPATPAFQVLRYTSESLSSEKQTAISAEIRADKNVTDILHTGFSIGGSLDGELVDGSYEDFMEAALRGTWSTDALINGIDRKSFTFEKTTEEGATDSYMRYRGCFIDGMRLAVAEGGIGTIGFDILGMGVDSGASAIITGATYVAAGTTAPMTGSDMGSIAVGGISTLNVIKGIDLTIAGNNREQRKLGSDDLAGVALGRIEVSGTLDLYFEGIEVYDAIIAHDTAALTFPIGSVTGQKYTITIPKMRLLTGDPISGGQGQDVAFSVGFQGYYDSGIGGTIQIDRNVS